MTRTAVLSDIHGNLPALEAVIADAVAMGCDSFLNLGDSLSGPLWPTETADLLIARDWPTITGNHERQLFGRAPGPSDAFAAARLTDRHWRWIESLPPRLALGDTLLCHGTLSSDIEHLLFCVNATGFRAATDEEINERLGSAPAMTLCGHSHVAGERVLPDGRRVANPGSVGLQAYTDDRPHPYAVANDTPQARYAILKDGHLTFRRVDYDHRVAARRAREGGFDAWATWLETGKASSIEQLTA
ncbi:metallophosphoesterase family protein [uncultured Sphingomonas sp.]|uniref:metallophosphoesterase family protein n=1 Tax=uncultured Sphingomonas sp. TaxID=158754 RepID=UPI0025D7D420|nr:metallophosphoesterase family protein [uncultured Sphingomonas sp.]